MDGIEKWVEIKKLKSENRQTSTTPPRTQTMKTKTKKPPTLPSIYPIIQSLLPSPSPHLRKKKKKNLKIAST